MGQAEYLNTQRHRKATEGNTAYQHSLAHKNSCLMSH